MLFGKHACTSAIANEHQCESRTQTQGKADGQDEFRRRPGGFFGGDRFFQHAERDPRATIRERLFGQLPLLELRQKR